jgi:hypothetical protein
VTDLVIERLQPVAVLAVRILLRCINIYYLWRPTSSYEFTLPLFVGLNMYRWIRVSNVLMALLSFVLSI